MSRLWYLCLKISQNRQGKTRLSKWYVPYDDDEKANPVWLPQGHLSSPVAAGEAKRGGA